MPGASHRVVGPLVVSPDSTFFFPLRDWTFQVRLREPAHRFGEQLLLYLSLLAQLNLSLENVDFAGQRLGHLTLEPLFPAGLSHRFIHRGSGVVFLQLAVVMASRAVISAARRLIRAARVNREFPRASGK